MIAWTISGLNGWLSHAESCSTLIANSSLNDQKSDQKVDKKEATIWCTACYTKYESWF